LLGEAIEADPARRAELLREVARSDEELARELEEWLAVRTQADGFLETPAHPDAVRGGRGRLALGPGARIGRYEVTAVLGFGSSGVVLEARQSDPDRLVALKVLQRGITSPVALQRFFDEARALARLRHPGVAQVFETGTFRQEGVSMPYIAMERVEGARDVVTYAEERGLGREARIGLLLDMCDAVGHGHERGVVHRDLKPANVLVDVDGRLRVIDFGIARIRSDSGEAQRLTSHGDLLGTLAYMSPEQGEGDPDAVDTRSDVYALGVLAYELLCGRLPIQPDTGSLLEAARRLQQTPPTRPRSIDASIPRDLEAVLLRALEKEPARRYATAHELGADLRRLREHRPVEARPPGFLHQAALLARRYRGTVTALGLGSLALVAAVLGLSWHTARVEARERAKSERITQFLSSILSAARPSVSARGDVSLREVLEDAAGRLETELADAPEARAELHATIGVAFRELGNLDGAVEQLRMAVELARASGDEAGFWRAAWLNALGDVLVSAGRHEEAEHVLREALEVLEDDSRAPAAFRGITFNHLARALHGQRRLDEARGLADRSRELYVGSLGEGHEAVSAAEMTLGRVARSAGDLPEAEARFRSAHRRDLDNHGAGSLQAALSGLELGETLLRRDQPGQAAELLEPSARTLGELLPIGHPDLRRAEALSAEAARRAGRSDA
jgi:serine/threonine protein kinase